MEYHVMVNYNNREKEDLSHNIKNNKYLLFVNKIYV